MADPKTIRINDAHDPDRLEKFEAALKRSGQNLSEVIRRTADAYIEYEAEHGHGPNYPFTIISKAAKARAKRKRKPIE